MARKNLLSGLMGATPDGEAPAPSATPSAPSNPPTSPPPGAPGRVDTARPRYTGGAIGAVSQSIADLKSRAVLDIDPGLIDAGGLRDRIEETEEDHLSLKASIRDYGLQVPLLVRPSPEAPGRYQIVYGRRRLLALRELGLPARVLVRDLDDAGVVMAQGQENAQRRDLSFIEKCNFARQMRDAGYDRKAIGDALNVDKTLISRMLSVADNVPTDLIEGIGSAPGIGRDRWLDLSGKIVEVLAADEIDVDHLLALASTKAMPRAGQTASDARFDVVHDRIDQAAAGAPHKAQLRVKPVRAKAHNVVSDNGFTIARVERRGDRLTIALPKDINGFDEWLADSLQEIYRDWIASKGDRR